MHEVDESGQPKDPADVARLDLRARYPELWAMADDVDRSLLEANLLLTPAQRWLNATQLMRYRGAARGTPENR